MNSVILEIRAGTGGDEAGLFASELLRMYQRFAQSQNWKFRVLSTTLGGLGNLKQATAEISAATGEDVFKLLKNESGVHRVQRVPQTEKSGRIHTSTITVAILPPVATSQVEINPKDIKVETFRASSHGGQNVQKTETAVRLTHLPTGVVVSCQDERSQKQNKIKAEEILQRRLFQMMQEQKKSKVDELRREQIGSASREEKIRTYNFPQNRVTDHRLGKSWHKLKEVLDGNLRAIGIRH